MGESSGGRLMTSFGLTSTSATASWAQYSTTNGVPGMGRSGPRPTTGLPRWKTTGCGVTGEQRSCGLATTAGLPILNNDGRWVAACLTTRFNADSLTLTNTSQLSVSGIVGSENRHRTALQRVRPGRL